MEEEGRDQGVFMASNISIIQFNFSVQINISVQFNFSFQSTILDISYTIFDISNLMFEISN